MPLHGWIIYNGNLTSDKFIDFATMLQEAARELNSTAEIIKNNELLSILSDSEIGLLPTKQLPDYVIFTDKDIYLAKQLEYLGVPVFNQAEAIAISDDKIATYQQLAHKKLAIPKTIVAPKIFISGSIDEAMIKQISQTLTFPLILKEAFGSFGEQVYLIDSDQALRQKIIAIGNRPFVFQEFIATSSGVDLRLQVVGDQVVAAMKRTSATDFRANVTAGGTMEAYRPTAEENRLAVAATKAIGADFAGVDLLFGEDGPLICEVNSNAHIRNLLDCTGINVAEPIVQYVLNKCGEGK